MQIPSSTPVLNYEVALARMGNEKEIYNAVAEVYQDSILQLIVAMGKGAESGDHEKVMREAHSAKSSSRIVGAEVVGEWAELLESAGKNEEDQKYHELIAHITNATKEVLPLIRSCCA